MILLIMRSSKLRWTIFLAATLCGADSQAQTRWLNPRDGFFETPSNWTPHGIPDPNSTVRFTLPLELKVGLFGDQTVAGLEAAFGSDLTFRIAGNSSPRTLQINGDIDVDSSSLALEGNGTDRFHANVTGNVNFSGESQGLTLDHAGLNVGGDLDLSDDMAKTLRLVNGALLNTTSATVHTTGTSEVFLSGTNTTWSIEENLRMDLAAIPASTEQVFKVLAGAELTVQGTTFGEIRTILVDGVGDDGLPTTWNTGGLSARIGRMSVENGAVINSHNVSYGATGETFVQGGDNSGNPSTWNIDGEFSMDGISPRIWVSNGGQLISQSAALNASTQASLEVWNYSTDDITRWRNSGDVFVGGTTDGSGGVGYVEIAKNGAVEVGGTIKIWPDSLVKVEDNGVLIADTIELDSPDSLLFESGTLQVNRFTHDLNNPSGRLTPGGQGTGSTLIVGDYRQGPDATLALDIGGSIAGTDFDQVEVAGPAAIDGLLELSLLDGFAPTTTDQFIVTSAANVVGNFDNVRSGERLETLDGRGSFVVNYGIQSPFDAHQIVLSDFMLLSGLTGDFNGDGLLDALDIDLLGAEVGGTDVTFDVTSDGVIDNLDREHWVRVLKMTQFGDADMNGAVEFSDFLTLSSGFGGDGGWADGDFDGSGDVGFADFLMLSNNFGSNSAAAIGVSSVPEPTSGMMATFALLGWFGARRGRGRRHCRFR